MHTYHMRVVMFVEITIKILVDRERRECHDTQLYMNSILTFYTITYDTCTFTEE